MSSYVRRPTGPIRWIVSACFVFLVAIVLLPVLGYWLTVLDIRAYLRALRGVLVRISSGRATISRIGSAMRRLPASGHSGSPGPVPNMTSSRRIGRLAKELHPDRGGDVRRFLLLQDHQEQAYYFLRQRSHRL